MKERKELLAARFRARPTQARIAAGQPADRQIRDLLGPVHQAEFNSWKHWVVGLAAKPHPSSVFGLPTQAESAK